MNKKETKLANLQANLSNIEIKGIVLSKQSANQLNESKGVLNFVLRDSKIDYINVACWGGKTFLDDICSKIQVFGNPIKLKNPSIKPKQNSESHWQPWTSSPFELSINEGSSSIEVLDNNGDLNTLVNIPIRDHNDYYTLKDVQNFQIQNTEIERDVNLLFLIRNIGQIEEIISKSNKIFYKLELIIFDQTVHDFSLTIWDKEVQNLAQRWTLMETTIFANDVTIKYDKINKRICGSCSSRTIFIPYPNTTEGFQLYNARNNLRLPPILTGVELMKSRSLKCDTIEELKNILSEQMLDREFVQINAYITTFDIDNNDSKRLFPKRCKGCYSFITQPNGKCLQRTCDDLRHLSNQFTKNFETTITLSDYTSTISNVKTTDKPFQIILGHKIEEHLNDEQMTEIKWKFLLEKWNLLIKVSLKDNENINYDFKLIHLEPADE